MRVIYSLFSHFWNDCEGKMIRNNIVEHENIVGRV